MKTICVQNVKFLKQTYKTDIDKIVTLNNISKQKYDYKLGDMIEVKQNITTPLDIDDKLNKDIKNNVYYVVKPFESIYTISSKFDVDINQLKSINNCNNFFAGQRIKIK